jgi:hypothetical protein
MMIIKEWAEGHWLQIETIKVFIFINIIVDRMIGQVVKGGITGDGG